MKQIFHKFNVKNHILVPLKYSYFISQIILYLFIYFYLTLTKFFIFTYDKKKYQNNHVYFYNKN